MTDLERAAVALAHHLMERHWNGQALVGPDYGVRLNYRLGRFVKSYLRALPWRDDLVYEQAQGYWILAASRLRELTGEERYAGLIDRCAAGILQRQRPDGSWPYPNPAWRGRVATVEGIWAALGLLDSAREPARAGALRWQAFLEREIGYRRVGHGLAVNYFAGSDGAAVPNNSALALRFIAALTVATGDDGHLARAPGLLAFVAASQRDTGEIPYSIGNDGRIGTEHFQCIQYNAFQCIDLLHYAELSGDRAATEIAQRIALFLSSKVDAEGRLPYACGARDPAVTYHHAAAAAALSAAGHPDTASPIYRRVLSRQRACGGFPHSTNDYGVLSDRRSYPRSQAMILHHLLQPSFRGSP